MSDRAFNPRALGIPPWADELVKYVPVRMTLAGHIELPPPPPIADGYRLARYGEEGADAAAWARVCFEAGEMRSEDDPEAALSAWFEKNYRPFESALCKRMHFVLDSAGRAVATATAWFDQPEAIGMAYPVAPEPSARKGALHWVSVVPRAQGLSLAKVVVGRCLEVMRKLHSAAGEVYLPTQTTSARAIGMYSQFGFVPEPWTPGAAYTPAEVEGWKEVGDVLKRPFPLDN